MSEDRQDEQEQKPATEELLSHESYEELMKKLNEAEEKANDYWDRILRMKAESENIRKRMQRDIEETRKFGIKDFVEAIIPIVDSLELSINNVPNDKTTSTESVLEGVKLTLKMFYSAMEKFGIKQINPISEDFNPEVAQAISMQVDQSVKPGTVISVLQKGYSLNERLIRPALVIVSKSENE